MATEQATEMPHRPRRAQAILNAVADTARVDQLMKRFHVPGLAISLVVGSDISTTCYGLASLEPRRPVQQDTVFDAASTSKSLTAAAVALLVEDKDKHKDLEWTTPVATLMPDDFVLVDEVATQLINVEDILSHRTGLPRHDLSYHGVESAYPDNPKSITRSFRHLPMNAGIRSRYQYSNIMYTAAVHLLETLSGESFAVYLRKHFFIPLEMESTWVMPSSVIAAGQGHRLATAYDWREGEYHAEKHNEQPEAQGAGNIHTTAGDYAKWVRAMLQKRAPVTRKVFKAVTTPRTITNGAKSTRHLDPFTSYQMYCLGWEQVWYRGVQIIKHDGLYNCGSNMFLVPQYDFGAYIIGNSAGANDLGDLFMHELIDEVLGIAADQRIDWERRALIDCDLISDDGGQEEDSDSDAAGEGEDQVKNDLGVAQSSFLGTYHNPGYRHITITERDQKLSVDGSDRSMPFVLVLEHLRDDKVFQGYLTESGSDTEEVDVLFRWEGDKVVAVGIELEEAMQEGVLIWFDRE